MRPARAVDLRNDARARLFRREAVLAPDRNLTLRPAAPACADAAPWRRCTPARRLRVGHRFQHPRVGDQPRIGGHDAVDVGPDPQLARRPAPRREMDAEKSDPPRPSVVGRPSSVEPLNPVITGSTRFSSSGRSTLAARCARGFHQRRRVAEHRVGGDHLGPVDRRGANALRLQIFGHQQRGQAARRPPWLRPPSAEGARPASSCPWRCA